MSERENARSARRIGLVIAGEGAAASTALLHAATELAAQTSGRLDVIALRETTAAEPLLPPALPGDVAWWDCVPVGPGSASCRTTTSLVLEALREILGPGDEPCLVVVAPGHGAEELAAALAAALQGPSLGRCRTLRIADGSVVAERDALGGRVRVELRSGAAHIVAALRPAAAAAPAQGARRPPSVRRLVIEVPADPAPVAEVLSGQDSRPALDGARLVVSGGRGIGGAEGFELLARLADGLGGALGGSLPTVDAGWIPAARQVGQSGKFVSPTTYLAIAISGTPQHLAGISGDSRLIAINNDPDATIFKRAQIGIVGDWREIVEALLELLEARRPKAA